MKKMDIQTSQTTTNMKYLLSSAGALGGLYYAFKKNKSALGYVGFFVLGAIAGNLAGMVIGGVLTPVSANKNASKQPVVKNATPQAENQPTSATIKGAPVIVGTETEE